MEEEYICKRIEIWDGVYTIDRTETRIVRCKDCKYFGYLGDEMCYLPNGDGGFAGWKVDPEGFCAWGEREVMEWSGKTASTS